MESEVNNEGRSNFEKKTHREGQGKKGELVRGGLGSEVKAGCKNLQKREKGNQDLKTTERDAMKAAPNP